MEPSGEIDLNKFFKKILNSIFFGMLWFIGGTTAGIYYELAFFNGKPVFFNVIYYACLIISLVFLIRYLVRIWK